MGWQLNHVLGQLQQFAAMIENPPGTFVAPASADFMQLIDSTIGFERDPEIRDDAQDGLDDYELTDAKQTIPVTLNRYIHAAASAGAESLDGRLLRSVFNTVTPNPGVSVTYSLSTSQQMNVLSLYRRFQANAPLWAQNVAGFACNEWEFAIGGNEKPKYTFTGEAALDVETGNAATSNTTGSGATVTFASPRGRGFEPGSRVQIAAQTNVGAGFVVTANTDTTITVSPNHAGYTSGDLVIPFCPTPTLVGSILGHTLGSMTVDGVAYPIKKSSYKVTKNLEYVKDEFGSDHMTDAIIGRRVTMVTATIRAREDFIIELGRRKLLVARNQVHNVGPTTGRYVQVNCPRIVYFPGPVTTPQTGVGEIELRGIALATTRGASDPISVVYF